jgi:hypothetical protein
MKILQFRSGLPWYVRPFSPPGCSASIDEPPGSRPAPSDRCDGYVLPSPSGFHFRCRSRRTAGWPFRNPARHWRFMRTPAPRPHDLARRIAADELPQNSSSPHFAPGVSSRPSIPFNVARSGECGHGGLGRSGVDSCSGRPFRSRQIRQVVRIAVQIPRRRRTARHVRSQSRWTPPSEPKIKSL